jgi:colicin import membrane protein
LQRVVPIRGRKDERSSAEAAFNDPQYRYGSKRPGMWRSAALALLIHLLLVAVLIFSVRIPSRAPEVVTVELWEPPAPEPKAEPKPEPPKPEPKAEPPPPPPPPAPKPEPQPEIKKPDIVEQEKPKPKPPPKKEEPRPKPKPKPAPPKRDVEFERRMKEELAQEQKRLQEEQKAAEAARQERELKELIAKQQAAAAQKGLATWTDKIRQRIRQNIIYDLSRVQGNPEAVFDVTLLPTGEVLNVTKRKSSGNPGYDEAVERAISKASPLPKPDSPSLFRRQLELHFRPQDQ